ncbi:MAG: ABC transporter substrate-binding protein [Yoonia sp.]|uniref:ABC transporter substrate-binding protein n=1 Tax=Yoonia sp. TaxID=2212373 RepID=UPI003EF0A3CA
MGNLKLSIALGNYDRVQPLVRGAVQIDGVDPAYLMLPPEEMMFRAFTHHEFDISELSLSGYATSLTKEDPPYIGIPVFLSRAFRHASFYVRAGSGIEKPQDLKGRKIGISEFQSTANVWARAILQDEYGVDTSDIHWVRGNLNEVGPTRDKSVVPAGVDAVHADVDRSLDSLLLSGDIDGFIGPRPPASFVDGHADVKRLFPDSVALAQEYYRETGIFPIMHILGLRSSLAQTQPWLPATLFNAFNTAKNAAIQDLCDTQTPKASLPFLDEQLRATRDLLGSDFWSYGLTGNRENLDTFLRHHNRQGLSPRKLEVDELFHSSTLNLFGR